MAAATLRPQRIAATDHGEEVLLLQSTAMSANVVFINIDWKESSFLSPFRRLPSACLDKFPSPPVATDPSGWRDGPKQFGQLVRAILAQIAVAAPAFFGARPPAVDRRGAMGRGERNRVRRGSKSSKPTPSIAPRLHVRHEPKARPAVRRAAPPGDAAPGAAQVAARTNVGSLPIGWDVIFDPESNEW